MVSWRMTVKWHVGRKADTKSQICAICKWGIRYKRTYVVELVSDERMHWRSETNSGGVAAEGNLRTEKRTPKVRPNKASCHNGTTRGD